MHMTSPIPEDQPGVTAYITVNNARDAIEWYEEILGAKTVEILPGEDNKVVHARLTISGGTLMLADDFPETTHGNSRLPENFGGSPVTLHVYVEDVDATFAKALDLGAIESDPIQDAFWGDRYGVLVDPYGHRWSIATRQKDMTADEVQEAFKAVSQAD